MLKPALLYKEELEKLLIEIWYDEFYKYYTFDSYSSNVEIYSNNYHQNQFVSVDKNNNVIGFISYNIDRNVPSAKSLGVINFDKIKGTNNKVLFGKDLVQAIDDIFFKFKFSKLEFAVAIGNPIRKNYLKLIKKYNGRVIGTRIKSVRLINGELCDV
ncbi:MAG: hypothetical protein B6I28_06460, partial [Fusobacteriia bacterium 4572_132]